MIGTVEAKRLAITLSLEQWVNLISGQFMDIRAEGIYRDEGIQLKLGPMIFTGLITNYAIMLTHMSWGLGDPTDSENSAMIEEFILDHGGTAEITYFIPGEEPLRVWILDGKYVPEDEFHAGLDDERTREVA